MRNLEAWNDTVDGSEIPGPTTVWMVMEPLEIMEFSLPTSTGERRPCLQVDPPSVEDSKEVSGKHPMEVREGTWGMMVGDCRKKNGLCRLTIGAVQMNFICWCKLTELTNAGWFVGGFFVLGVLFCWVFSDLRSWRKFYQIPKCLAWNKTAYFLNCFSDDLRRKGIEGSEEKDSE